MPPYRPASSKAGENLFAPVNCTYDTLRYLTNKNGAIGKKARALLMRSVFERVAYRRRAMRLSRRAICDASGVSSSAIAALLRASSEHAPRRSTLAAIAPVLMTSVDWLQDEAGPEVVMPDDAVQAKIEAARGRSNRKRGKGRKAVGTDNRDVVVGGDATTVTIMGDVQGDVGAVASTVGNLRSPLSAESRAEFFGLVLDAYAVEASGAGRNLPLPDLGKLVFEQFAALVLSCEHPDELPHALEIARTRARRLFSANDEAR